MHENKEKDASTATVHSRRNPGIGFAQDPVGFNAGIVAPYAGGKPRIHREQAGVSTATDSRLTQTRGDKCLAQSHQMKWPRRNAHYVVSGSVMADGIGWRRESNWRDGCAMHCVGVHQRRNVCDGGKHTRRITIRSNPGDRKSQIPGLRSDPAAA